MTDLISRLYRYGKELQVCNEAADEIERLTQALKKANDQAEHFEREWYLRGDEIEHQQLCIRDLNGILNEKRAEIERLRAALTDIAQHQDSEWPLRCRMNVRTARAALKEPT